MGNYTHESNSFKTGKSIQGKEKKINCFKNHFSKRINRRKKPQECNSFKANSFLWGNNTEEPYSFKKCNTPIKKEFKTYIEVTLMFVFSCIVIF